MTSRDAALNKNTFPTCYTQPNCHRAKRMIALYFITVGLGTLDEYFSFQIRGNCNCHMTEIGSASFSLINTIAGKRDMKTVRIPTSPTYLGTGVS